MKQLYHFLAPRLPGYCLGMFLTAVGVCFCVASNLGTAPGNCIPYVVSYCTQVDLGLCTTLTLSIIIGIQALVLGRQFKLSMCLQMFGTVIFGGFISIANRLFMMAPLPTTRLLQLMYIALAVVFIAVGVLVYMDHNIVCLPMEGLVQAFHVRFHVAFSTGKIMADWSAVLIAALISMVCVGSIVGIGIGTVATAFGVGLCMKVVRKFFLKEKITQG